jgi:hypothetical protein
MLRWLSALVLLLFAAGCAAQEPAEAEEPDVITGYVSSVSTISEPFTEADPWQQSVILAAWRQGNGPVEVTELHVQLAADSASALRDVTAQFPKQRLVRIKLDGPITRGETFFEGKLGEALGPGDSAELLAAAEAIFNPEPIEDAEFGTFRADGDWHDAFAQQREWFDRPVTTVLMLRPYGADAADQALSGLRAVWNDREALNQQVRAAIGAEIHQRWNEDHRAADEPMLDQAGFAAKFDLRAVSVWPDGRAELIYFAEDFSWTSRVTARVSRADSGEWSIALEV